MFCGLVSRRYCHTILYTAKNQSKRAASRRVSQNKSPNKGYKNPPQVVTELVGTQTFRFKYNKDENDFSLIFYDLDLLNMLSNVIAPASTASRIFESVKLKRVEMWNANIANTAHTISLEWLRTYPFGNKTSIHSDTAVGTAEPAHIFVKPPKDSYCRVWLSGSDEPKPLFQVSLCNGTIIDITLSYVVNVNAQANAASVPVPALPQGTLFVPVLYGVLIPQSVNH